LSLLRKQGYHLVGGGAVKSCLWLGRGIRGKGSCYKSRFYGIASHRCIQMTPVLVCNHRCLHCWRPLEMPQVSSLLPPGEMVDAVIAEHRRLVSGYGGSPWWEEACHPRHAAISLAGEPTLYPWLVELIEEFHRRGFTTFLVTNGTNPGVLEMVRPTQLYVSLNAPNHETYLKVCRPLADRWKEVKQSLSMLGGLETRTAVRITLVKGVNMIEPEGYAELLEGGPDYVEVKAYMHLGSSRGRLERSAMPDFQEVRGFSEKIVAASSYKIAAENQVSRVVLLSRDGRVEPLRVMDE